MSAAGGGQRGGDLLRGRVVMPPDLAVAVGMADAWDGGLAGYVITAGVTGPVRVIYSMTEPAGPTWTMRVQPRERRRRRAVLAGLAVGLLENVPERTGGETPHGWASVTAWGRTAWAPLDADGLVDGRPVPVADLVVALVPDRVWVELHTRRARAWERWRSRSVHGLPNGGNGGFGSLVAGSALWADTTVRDGAPHNPAANPADATMVNGVIRGAGGAWAGGRAVEGMGWPGIRHGARYNGSDDTVRDDSGSGTGDGSDGGSGGSGGGAW
ncbi:hypothetical protein [Actinomadura parmotrematis]|uniref:Uncharacterized protein n=1 Tax=Actinomadura parmotrematis TaxID=2864039 RepID=A0ABS7G3A7_9ACTN|nr:hypothetical protein [Actinomadura parmotrematis]MBW8486705.1 hypothetical protein [Actinomadura parmotrematis]